MSDKVLGKLIRLIKNTLELVLYSYPPWIVHILHVRNSKYNQCISLLSSSSSNLVEAQGLCACYIHTDVWLHSQRMHTHTESLIYRYLARFPERRPVPEQNLQEGKHDRRIGKHSSEPEMRSDGISTG